MADQTGPSPSGERMAGKFVLITGGTTGIGLETAKLMASEGARVPVDGGWAQLLEIPKPVAPRPA